MMISGANRGIGAALAEKAKSAGWRVSLGARNKEDLIARHGQEDDYQIFNFYDATVAGSDQGWVDNTNRKMGRIDALVNNAGYFVKTNLMDVEDKDLDDLWAINVKGPLKLCQKCIPHLKKSGHGRIVNLSSLSGKRAKNLNVGYNMTKFAMMGMTHTLRQATWEMGIRCTAICPSFVNTDMGNQSSKAPSEDMIQPETLSEIILTNIELPNNAAIAEILVNCRLEDML